MSDILADIDDTLAEWHGSKDSMHWSPDSPEATQEPNQEATRVFARHVQTDPTMQAQDPMSRYLDSLTRSLDLLRPLTTYGELPPP